MPAVLVHTFQPAAFPLLTVLPFRSGIVKAVGKALNKDPKIVLYQPEELGLGKSGKADGFPFR